MTIHSWIKQSTASLEAANIATARLDSLVLLEDALHKDRSWLLAHPEMILTEDTEELLKALLERRSKHEPLAYIRGKTEFYGREFAVNPHTLEPRPETETMIDLLKEQVNKLGITDYRLLNVADIGTGSGAIGITAALELPGLAVTITDVDQECLHVARRNIVKHKADIAVLHGDLLAPLVATRHNPPAIILCNLPYVPDSHTINQAAMQEPKHAIFGGQDGLDLYRRLFDQLDELSPRPHLILTESLPFQHEMLASIASDRGYELKKTMDFIQVFFKP